MRWIETPPAEHPEPDRPTDRAPEHAGRPADDASATTGAAAGAVDGAVLSRVLDARRSLMTAVEEAHRRAADTMEAPADDRRPAAAMRRAGARAHRERAEAHRLRGSLLAEIAALPTSTLAGLDAADLESLAVSDELGGDALRSSSGQVLAAALESSAELPDGERGVSRPPLPVRVGVIGPAAVRAAFSGAADVVALTAETWHEEAGELDLVILSSGPGLVPDDRSELVETVLPGLRAHGVPTVYFARNRLRAGRLPDEALACSHIVCLDSRTAAHCRAEARRAVDVAVVPAPVNPLRHTPIGTRPARTELVALTGMDQDGPAPHLDAAQDEHHVPPLLDGLLGSGRPAALMQPAHAADPQAGDWTIPSRYAPWTVPVEEALAADETCGLDRLQRGMDVAATVQAVVDSQELFDSRVLELLASGTLVISTYNQGVNTYLPQVRIANSAEDVATMLETMTLEELRRVQGEGIRAAFADHHAVDVLRRICEHAGVAADLDAGGDAPRTETVLAVADRRTAALEADLGAQTHGAVELVTWDELAHRPADGAASADAVLADVVLPVTADRRYAPTYAADHVTAFRLQQARTTAKLDGDVEETDEASHRHHAGGLAALAGRTRLGLSGWWRPTVAQLVSPGALLASGRGRRIYALDHLGHRPAVEAPEVEAARVRRPLPDPARGDDLAVAAEQIRAAAAEQRLVLSVVVPVFNNGDHLRHKAFASLRRSTLFAQMHVLLVDDGSTDPSTVETVEELAHAWPNVSAVHHPAGGSGSASRPRNTGLQLAATPYVTYLDPDDEELDDGYWELLERLEAAPEADFALGTMAVWTHRHQVHDYHAWYADALEHRDGLFRMHPESLAEVNFRPASIEAMVARTDWLQSLELVQPVGAVGQDTYFFQQMFHSTRAYAPVYRPVYTYYGAVETSTVNVVSPQYFRKYLILERERAAWLREVGLMDRYLAERFERFFVTWYLEKFTRVRAEQRPRAAAVLREIAAAYVDVDDYDWSSRAARRFFDEHGR
ncbi:glycosyltransferase [Nesterenkonia sp. F]|uniref:glycosyltransferase n=1 Tax=Nesterenkonia sp. F TaxID=795955 RepID=UPI000255D553|nr:glycosyltransferase [Nesterenkonia sp. F]